ncbi:MAG TPA: acyl-CoA dehydrogenase family protein [Solirubrobacteraceae bacterium]|jgi:alkylation response protein AidB-like acyl-CoA dehydrogenase|nr:acyl-CoA dehydrogenase family protein [Solirubrobacteraceae bacterium]
MIERDLYTPDHESFRQVVREFVRREVSPNMARWEEQRFVDRDSWRAAARQGVLGLPVPKEYGGLGVGDFRYQAVISEEMLSVGAISALSGWGANDNLILPYLVELGTDEQLKRWVAGFATGDTVAAIAMTEPGAGSDLRGIKTNAVRDGEDWILNGSKTFITNGIMADLVIVFAVTDPDAGSKGYSLFVVERDMPGFERGKKLNKIGIHAQDTAELFFNDVRLPSSNLLGQQGQGLAYLMQRLPRERMTIAICAQSFAESALRWTVDYVKSREAFGQRIADLQTVGFTLAELTTEVEISRAFVDRAIQALNAKTLSAVDAAKAKWWTTELQSRVIDRGLQLHGGYGYMLDYPIARAYIDTRVQTIYGGTTEVMKEIIRRDIVGR